MKPVVDNDVLLFLEPLMRQRTAQSQSSLQLTVDLLRKPQGSRYGRLLLAVCGGQAPTTLPVMAILGALCIEKPNRVVLF